MPYRATRTEPRVGIGSFTLDFEKGVVYPEGETKDGRNNIPPEVADYLTQDGLLVWVADGSTDNAWFDSDDEELATAGDPPAKNKK
jgi:hypothetical protein